MKIKCILKTQGFDFSFYFFKSKNLPDGVNSIVTFVGDDNLKNISIKSPVFFVYFSDLQRLIGYLEERIFSLESTPKSELCTFVTYALKFQIKALSGEICSEISGDSYFGIQCMLKPETSSNNVGNTYLGGESNITLENAQNFVSSLRTAIANLADSC